MSASKYRQDMPPPGGYGAVNWARKVSTGGLSGYAIFGIFFGVTGLAWTAYYFERQHRKRLRLEINDARLAVCPLLKSEEHRMFLRRLRQNRDEENELMKNVPGWETGKWKGQPVYHDMNGRFNEIHLEEYYAHSKPYDHFDRVYEFRKH